MRNTIHLLLALFLSLTATSQEFKFAVISDMYVNPTNSQPLEDLTKVVDHINLTDIDFVLVLGNITERGDKESMIVVKNELDRLSPKYYVVSGYNETKSGESGATAFEEVFGSERFDFQHDGIRFLGFASGPIVRRMDGHVSTEDVFWLDRELSQTPKMPTIVATHMPLALRDVDNWYQVTDVLRQYNVKAILTGNYRKNMKTTYDNIPALINRSTLRDAYDGLPAYNVYTVNENSITAAMQKVEAGIRPAPWADYSLRTQYYAKDTKKLRRPDFSINNKYPKVSIVWARNIFQTIYTSLAYNGDKVFFGDDKGVFYAFKSAKDDQLWKYETGGRIVGTADANQKVVVFGSTDKTIYGLDVNTGNVLWQQTVGAPVLGSAKIDGNTVYIGASDGAFRALDVNTGAVKWQYLGVGDYIECKPLVYNDVVAFGAWDNKLYVLDKNTGNLMWEWSNAKQGRRSAPAAVSPVASNGKIFFTTPNGYLNAVHISTGDSIWSTNESRVSESIGISEDGQRLYAKTVQDSVVCFSTLVDEPKRIWSTDVGYGFDPSASMLVEKGGTVFGSTKNGVIFALNAKDGAVLWQYKACNTHIGTVVPVNKDRCLYVTALGTVGMVEGRKN